MNKVRCTIHNVEFGADKSVETWMIRCPICTTKEHTELREKLAVAVQHRDALLRAIEIKKLYENTTV